MIQVKNPEALQYRVSNTYRFSSVDGAWMLVTTGVLAACIERAKDAYRKDNKTSYGIIEVRSVKK